jgi:hypothetical protein
LKEIIRQLIKNKTLVEVTASFMEEEDFWVYKPLVIYDEMLWGQAFGANGSLLGQRSLFIEDICELKFETRYLAGLEPTLESSDTEVDFDVLDTFANACQTLSITEQVVGIETKLEIYYGLVEFSDTESVSTKYFDTSIVKWSGFVVLPLDECRSIRIDDPACRGIASVRGLSLKES